MTGHRHGPPKRCNQCGELKGLHEFRHSKREVDGHMRQCRTCDSARRMRSYYVNPEQERQWRLKSKLKQKYGMTLGSYEKMLAEQNGVCAICGGITEFAARLDVDHDHETGRVRALLCRGCNTGLGNFKDNELLLIRAAQYLRRYKP